MADSVRPVLRLAAVTGLTATLLGATVGVAAPAVAATPTQVALVVEYPDGTTSENCVAYRSGMTGADVLDVAGPTYGSGPYAGFVLQIGRQGTVPPTDDDYWAYWVTQGGKLVYSGAGVTSTHPAAGTVEAWHWNSSGRQERPAARSYGQVCPAGYGADPVPSSAAPAPGGGTGGGATAGGSTPRAGSAGTSTPAAGGTAGSRTTGATGDPAPAGTGPSATPSGTPSATDGGAAATASGTPGRTTSVAASDVAATTAGGSGDGRTVGLLVAAVAVLGLGGAAVVVRRRRAQGD